LSVRRCDATANRARSALTIGARSKDQKCEDDLHDANRKDEVHVDICGWRVKGAMDRMNILR
jgi:hypothetical protein